jgi:Tol biopolymer transport system component
MVHPSSINQETGAGQNAGSWLAYYIIQQSGTTSSYLWETTIVNAVAVILFGGEMTVEVSSL